MKRNELWKNNDGENETKLLQDKMINHRSFTTIRGKKYADKKKKEWLRLVLLAEIKINIH